MKTIFHLMAVYPAGLDPAGFEQVQLHDFFLVDDSLEAATAEILNKMFSGLEPRLAASIWGRRHSATDGGLFIGPSTRLNATVLRGDHAHWESVQTERGAQEHAYRCLHRGPTSLQLHFEEEARKRNPALHGTPLAAGVPVQSLRGELDSDEQGAERSTPPGTWGRLLRQDNPDQWLILFPNGATIYAEHAELRDPAQYTVGTRNLFRVVKEGNWYALLNDTLICGPVLANGPASGPQVSAWEDRGGGVLCRCSYPMAIGENDWTVVDLDRLDTRGRFLAELARKHLQERRTPLTEALEVTRSNVVRER